MESKDRMLYFSRTARRTSGQNMPLRRNRTSTESRIVYSNASGRFDHAATRAVVPNFSKMYSKGLVAKGSTLVRQIVYPRSKRIVRSRKFPSSSERQISELRHSRRIESKDAIGTSVAKREIGLRSEMLVALGLVQMTPESIEYDN